MSCEWALIRHFAFLLEVYLAELWRSSLGLGEVTMSNLGLSGLVQASLALGLAKTTIATSLSFKIRRELSTIGYLAKVNGKGHWP